MRNTNVESITFSTENLNEALASCTLDHISEGVMYTDQFHRIIYVNKQFEAMTGFTFEDVKGQQPQALESKIKQLGFYSRLHETLMNKKEWNGEIWQAKDKDHIYIQKVSTVIKDTAGESAYHVVIFSDLVDRESTTKLQLNQDIYYDSLTSLPNRALLEKHIVSVIDQWKDTPHSIAVLFFQLDHFSAVNEKYGLLFGDVILQRLSSRLNHFPYDDLFVTRWSGTEFACILEGVHTQADVERTISLIRQEIAAPLLINGVEVVLDSRFGAYIHHNEPICAANLLLRACTALKVAREEKTFIRFYDESMSCSQHMFIMEVELRKAIKEKQFELYYQPLISVKTGKLTGFEGLVRWIHPTEGIISPVKFIPLAEQTGLIEKIGEIVFEMACRQTVEWADKGYGHIKVYVNMSMNQLKTDMLTQNFKDIMKKTNVRPEDIGLELTESSISMDMEATIAKLRELKKLGLSIAIDDFGTGYASFGYLIDFPVDRIKVDRSYMKAMNDNEKITAIVAAIASIGQTLNMAVVAEGIETLEQFQQAKRLQFFIVQGYLFDRPLPKEEAEQRWLKENKRILL